MADQPQATVTVIVPHGYRSVEEFLTDCGLEQVENPLAQVVVPVAWSSNNQLEAISFTGDFAIIAKALRGSPIYGEALSALCRIELIHKK